MLLQLIVNGIRLGGIYTLVALAFSLNMGILGVLNIAIAEFFVVGALVGLDMLEVGVPFIVVILGSMGAAGVLALILETVGYRTVDKTDPIVTLLTTVAFGLIVKNVAERRWGSEAHFFPDAEFNSIIKVGVISVSVVQLLSLGCAVLLVALLAAMVRKTALGRGLRAVAQNRDAAVVLGLRVRRVEISTFLVSGLLAGGGGLLLGLNYGVISIDFGINVGISGIAAMILGGVDNLWGAVVAGPLLGLTAVLGTAYLGASYSNLLVFGLLALTLLFRPQGLLGSRDDLLRRV